MRRSALIGAFLVLLAATACATTNAQDRGSHQIHPDIGELLRDAAVSRGPGVTYYLTGSRISAR